LAKKFTTYSDIINLFAEGKEPAGIKLNPKFVAAMKEIVAKNIKPKVYIVSYVTEVTTYDTKKGIAMIKKAFGEVEKLGVRVNYLGAPRYRMMSEDSSYPKAEERIKQATTILEKGIANSTVALKKDKV
ncbi:MAG: hypothetical protein KGH49_04250, partial [Candidatus Micrarchaeota archaeon]|nr:hypothetical protein [Candidatus Micrarchaeota archaeon]